MSFMRHPRKAAAAALASFALATAALTYESEEDRQAALVQSAAGSVTEEVERAYKAVFVAFQKGEVDETVREQARVSYIAYTDEIRKYAAAMDAGRVRVGRVYQAKALEAYMGLVQTAEKYTKYREGQNDDE